MVVVLHQVEQVRSEFPETLLLAHAVIDWGPTERVLRPDNLLRAWGLPDAHTASPGVQRLRRSAQSAYALLIEPFAGYEFMRRALVACLALAMGCGPVGIILLLRRMSLMGDALGHAVLPGAAVGFLLAGLSLSAMSLGGLVAGLAVALLAGLVTRLTPLREDAALPLYLTSLALGVLIVSLRGSNVDLLNVLFGSVLAVDDQALLLVGSLSSLTLVTLALIYRPLVTDTSIRCTCARSGSAAGSITRSFSCSWS